MKKLEFDNCNMKLFSASMGKLHQIIYLTNDKNVGIHNDHITVANLQDRSAFSNLYANKLSSTGLKSCSGFFIKSDGNYFAVGLVSMDVEEINSFLRANSSYAMITKDNDGYLYTATLTHIEIESNEPI